MDSPEGAGPVKGARHHQGLIGLVVRRPVAVLMVVLAVATFGLVSLQKLPVTLLPDISYPTLTVRTEYEGAAPAEVEKLVTRALEENLSVISNLVGFRSISRAGVSDVILEFEWDTEMAFATQDVREKVDQVKSRLPQGVEHPLILRYDPTLDPIMRLALYASGDSEVDLYELRRVAEEDLRRQLESLPGIAAVRVRGGYEEEWRIELNEDRLKQRGIAASGLISRIGLENANVAGGVLRDGDRESLVRTLGEIRTLEELRELVVDVKGGEPVRIRDLGTVLRGFKERDVITRIEGRESVEIEIFKEAGANVVDVAHTVKTRLFGKNWNKTLVNGEYDPSLEPEEEEKEDDDKSSRRRGRGGGGSKKKIVDEKALALAGVMHQNGINARLLSDQSVFIEASISEVRDAALIGAVLAVLVLFAFLRRLSPTAIISVTIPISVVATFAPLFLAGVTLNIMSLGGLALGIGMLVDSAIVVLESISRRRESGDGVIDAAVHGTREVGLAVLASTLTTVAVFLPMVFVEGIAGEFFRDQALAVVFSLLASLIAALFFIPMLASRRMTMKSTGATGRVDLLRRLSPTGFDQYISVRRIRELRAGGGNRAAAWLGIVFEAIRLPIEFVARLALAPLLVLIVVLVGIVISTGKGIGLLLAPVLWVFDKAYAALEATYGVVLAGALKVRVVILLVAAGLTWFAWTRTAGLGVELVPKVHQGEFTVESQLDVGTPVETTDRVSATVADLIERALGREGITISGMATSAGVPRDVIAKAGEGKHSSKVHVRIDPEGGDLEALEERAKEAIRQEFASIAGAKRPIFVTPSLFSTKTSLEVEVIGPILEDIRYVADQVEARMRELDGLTDIQSTNRTGYPELVIRPDREQLTLYNLKARDVANLVRDKVQGAVSTRVSRGDRKIDVLVRAPRDEVSEPEDILNLRVNDDGTDPIPLRTVAALDQRPGPAEIRRVRGERAVILSADVKDLDLTRAAEEIEAIVAELRAENPSAFREVSVRVAGQREESDRSMQSMLFAGLIAVFLVYIVMASQFESLIHPLVILFTIPLALVGVVFALEALAIKVSVVVLIGVILLVGIVVNNAIVLVDCVNQRRREGLDRDTALKEAGQLRLRPILMTTTTTVLGLLPLAIGLGEGAEIRTPMAITVIAGLITSTVLTLVVIPVVYSLVSGKGPLATADAIDLEENPA